MSDGGSRTDEEPVADEEPMTDELPAAAGNPAQTADPVRERRPRRIDAGLDGILVVDKPVGPTSHDVVALVRRLAGTKRIGHGGTLDPFASGVLPLYLGLGTRVVEFHLGARKAYRATVCFGASSTTDDLEGELTPSEGPAPSQEVVEAALAGFLGTHLQLPPAFSARKIGGRRAYALARAGHSPELPARATTFHALSLERWDGTDPDRPLAVIDVACSAGTYVRALARDLGTAVGSAAYLGALRRTAAGPFTLDDAISLDVAREAAASGRFADLLIPVGTGLDDLPAVTLRPDEVVVVAHGGWIGEGGRLPAPSGIPAGGPVAGAMSSAAAGSSAGADRVRLVLEDGSLAAIARRAGGRLVPDKVLVPRAAAAPRG